MTVEFWLKWNSYANDDRLAMEFTNNFNEDAGGFLVDPNAPQLGGSFGVGIGSGASRNNVFFERPSAGAWHHYAFVLDTNAPAAQQITPYVDGKAGRATRSSTAAPAPATSPTRPSTSCRGRRPACSAPATSTRSRSTNAPSARRRSPNTTTRSSRHRRRRRRPRRRAAAKKAAAVEEGTGGHWRRPAPATTRPSSARPTLLHYWRLGEATGPTIADSVGSSPATATGGPTFGAPGGVPGDTNTARCDSTASTTPPAAPLHLSGKTAITVEFWLKWNSWANDDGLAMEFTPNFNENPGGFLVDPNAPQLAATSPSASALGASRNNAFFARPTAGQLAPLRLRARHSAARRQADHAYVDGKPVAYTKLDSGTGAGNFANSTLTLMSRAGSALFGAGDLHEVAIFGSALSATSVADNYKGIVARRSAAKGPRKKKNRRKKKAAATGSPTPKPCSAPPAWSTTGAWARPAVPVLADSAGPSPANTSGEPTLGVAGALPGDANTAVRFDGINDAASAAVDLSGKTAITLEFWLKWNGYANDDRLAMEFTQQLQRSAGRLPGRPQQRLRQLRGRHRQRRLAQRRPLRPAHGRASGTTTPSSSTRRRRPAEQVVPYVDGKPVAYSKADERHRSAAVRQLLAQLHVARLARSLFGAGDLDEVAIYDRAAERHHDRRPLRGHRRQQAPRRRPSPRPRPRKSAKRSPSTPPPPATPTARSPNTNGTSTATAATRPAPARPRRTSHTFATAGNGRSRPAGDRQLRRDRDDHARRSRSKAAKAAAAANRRHTAQAVARHPRPHRLLAAGREIGLTARRQRRRQPGDDLGEPTLGMPGASSAKPTRRCASTASTTPPAPRSTSPARPRSRSSSG